MPFRAVLVILGSVLPIFSCPSSGACLALSPTATTACICAMLQRRWGFLIVYDLLVVAAFEDGVFQGLFSLLAALFDLLDFLLYHFLFLQFEELLLFLLFLSSPEVHLLFLFHFLVLYLLLANLELLLLAVPLLQLVRELFFYHRLVRFLLLLAEDPGD